MKKLRILLFLFFLLSILSAGQNMNCFTIIVGKDCSLDGSVLLGHNEDDSGDMLVNMVKVPASKYSPNDFITLKNGGHYSQSSATNSYLWLEMPGLEFSDSYCNEFGVVIVSDNSPSVENRIDTTDGGIGYWLRRILAERATSAREAVQIGGALVEKFGYTQSGRSYCIADPEEAWVLSVVQGRRWVAQRVPDDQVMVIPNYYIIKEIDLQDSKNFLASSDIIQYAQNRGWHKPGHPFNFREVYGDKAALESTGNIHRHREALRLLADREYDQTDDLPFSFSPKLKLDLADIFALLRNHYEGSRLENLNKTRSPHEGPYRTICTQSTQYGFVAQLRNNVPKELTGILWYAPIQPCLHPFVPVYFNLSALPENFAYHDHKNTLSRHFASDYNEIKQKHPQHAFLSFVNFSHWVNEDYYSRSPQIIEKIRHYERENIEKHIHFDIKLQEEFSRNQARGQKLLDQYSRENLQMLISLQHD
jgi:dipeptidase